uniref:nicotinate-nucleotide--dimethylbenzimidazole phosphoribosyltransferase n=1 Tax=Clostridium sp. NkU-1 TaxID=1095009 RepID=UPI0032614067
MDILASVGGFDLAGLTGVFLGGAIYRIPVLVDGFISAVAALSADRIYPGCRNFMLASHVSAEPAGRLLLDELGLEPFIQAGMCLGEGTGAVAAIPLLHMAAGVYNTMSSFEDIQIEAYKPWEACNDHSGYWRKRKRKIRICGKPGDEPGTGEADLYCHHETMG